LPGKRTYPIPDKAHARNALARVGRHGTPAEQKKVKAAVQKRFPSLGTKSKKSRSVSGHARGTLVRAVLHGLLALPTSDRADSASRTVRWR